jgi:hypothetical protein
LPPTRKGTKLWLTMSYSVQWLLDPFAATFLVAFLLSVPQGSMLWLTMSYFVHSFDLEEALSLAETPVSAALK